MTVQVEKAVKKPVKKKVKSKKDKPEKIISAFDSLSDQHKLFVRAYIENFAVAYKAYKKVYPKVKDGSARVLSTKLLANVNIKKAIDEEYSKIWKEKDSEAERAKTYAMIHSIGESDISDVVDLVGNTLTVKDLREIPPAALQSIQSIEYIKKDGQYGTDENIKVRLHSKLQALEMRAKIQKLIDKEPPQQLEIKIVPAQRPGKEREEKGDDE